MARQLFLLLWMFVILSALQPSSALQQLQSSSDLSKGLGKSKISPQARRIRGGDLKASTSSSISSSSTSSSSSSSVLEALMESPYTDLMELMERAGMLESLEKVVGKGSITILAPRNAYLEQQVDSEFKRFLLEPGNVNLLRQVLKHHIIPEKIMSADWKNRSIRALSEDEMHIHTHNGIHRVELSEVAAPDAIVRHDGVVHGVNTFLVPRSVQSVFAAKKKGGLPSAMLPSGAPQFDPSATSLASMSKELEDFAAAAPSSLKFDIELAPSPSFAPAPAPGPSSGHHRVYKWEDVDDFVSSLANFGGYGEIAELLVNLTSFAWDMAKLVNEGHRLTLLAPNDEAIDNLTTEELNAPGGIEGMLQFHVLTEYQTEDSLYNAVKTFHKISFPTLHHPHTLIAQEHDGTVQFGHSALLYDHDIFTDGHISVQGINKVLSPPSPSHTSHPSHPSHSSPSPSPSPSSLNRRLQESSSGILRQLFG